MSINALTLQKKKQSQIYFLTVPLRFNTRISRLVITQVCIFLLYTVSRYFGLLDYSLKSGTIHDFITHGFALSSRSQDLNSYWLLSIFSYSFFHFRLRDLLISTGAVWLFGKILQRKIGETKVLQLYFLSTIFSAIVFLFSHWVFEIFSGPGGIMEGAFGGAVAIMTATVTFYGPYRLNVYRKVSFSLRELYLFILVLSLAFSYKHNLAYVMVYIFNSYLGYSYARYYRISLIRLKQTISIPSV